MAENLQKQSRELSTVGGISASRLAISRLLDQAAQVYQSEILPGQMKVWLDCFQSEKPETLQAAFSEYFKAGKFFPKPADIAELIALGRESSKVKDYQPIDAERTKQEQETKEWQQASEQARRMLAKLAGRTFDPVTNSKEKLKAQAQQLSEQRGKQQ